MRIYYLLFKIHEYFTLSDGKFLMEAGRCELNSSGLLAGDWMNEHFNRRGRMLAKEVMCDRPEWLK